MQGMLCCQAPVKGYIDGKSSFGWRNTKEASEQVLRNLKMAPPALLATLEVQPLFSKLRNSKQLCKIVLTEFEKSSCCVTFYIKYFHLVVI